MKTCLALLLLLPGCGVADYLAVDDAGDTRFVGPSNAEVELLTLHQSGLLNRQETRLGRFEGAKPTARVKSKARVNSISQSQSGVLNIQKISVGSVD
jgi:hypothetical protein